MKEQDKWMKKRMEDVPKPVVVGTFDMTEEEKVKADEDLKRLIEASTGKSVN